MKYKKFIITLSVLSVAWLSLGQLTVGAAPEAGDGSVASRNVTCKDGERVKAKADMAAPKDKLDDKDFKEACKKHGGYSTEDDGNSAAGEINDIGGSDCGGVDTAIIKCSQNNDGDNIKNNGVWGLLLMAINILTAGVGILAVGGIVYAAVLYTTAEDKADQVKKAMDTIQNVVIGLVMFALMWSLLNFIIPGGVFAG